MASRESELHVKSLFCTHCPLCLPRTPHVAESPYGACVPVCWRLSTEISCLARVQAKGRKGGGVGIATASAAAAAPTSVAVAAPVCCSNLLHRSL